MANVIHDDFKAMKINDLLLVLNQVKADHGNVKVTISVDEEGNGFSPVTFAGIAYDPNVKEVIFYPLMVQFN